MNMAKKIAGWLCRSGAIREDEEELYIFAICNTFLTLVPLVSVLLIAYMMDSLPEGLALVIPFLTIRKFSGGFHFDSAVKCMITSILLLVMLLIISLKITLLPVFDAGILLAGISVSVNSPIDSEARRLDDEEIRRFKRTAGIISLVFILIYLMMRILSAILNMPVLIRIERCLSSGMMLAAILQFPVLIRRRRP